MENSVCKPEAFYLPFLLPYTTSSDRMKKYVNLNIYKKNINIGLKQDKKILVYLQKISDNKIRILFHRT